MFTALRTAAAGRLGRRIRLAAAVAFLLLAGLSAIEDSRATPRSRPMTGTPVVVAARELPTGRLLRTGDLRVVRLPARVLPRGATREKGRLVGRRLAAPVTTLEPIVAPRLLGTGLTTGLPTGTVAAPVTLDSDVDGLVRTGDRVDLVATAGADELGEHPRRQVDPVTLVRGARVLAVLGRSDAAGTGTRLVLAVTSTQALAIAAARTSDVFTVVARAP